MAGKSILVIDTPNDCDVCPLNSHTEYDFDVCWVTQGKGGCPLRPLPQKVEMDFNEYYEGMADGWNACIDEITGETE